MDNAIQIISTLGFPISACIGVAFAFFKFYKNSEQRNKEREDAYLEQISKFTVALDKVNEILIKVNERLDDIERKLE